VLRNGEISFINEVIGGILLLLVLFTSIYIICDVKFIGTQLAENYSQLRVDNQYSKSNFLEQYVSIIEGTESIPEYIEQVQVKDINIDTSLFSEVCVRLNTQAYGIAANIITEEHFQQCIDKTSNLSNSVKKVMSPLMPMAATMVEMGMGTDVKYLWSAAVYTKYIQKTGIDISSINISNVDTNFYINNKMEYVLNCGKNCTAKDNFKSHVCILNTTNGSFRNDNDSLGPLQILRRYLELEGGKISYNCGAEIKDLLRWEDNVQYYFHKDIIPIAKCEWNKEYEIKSAYELVALLSVAHSTGSSYLNLRFLEGVPSTSWRNSQAIFDYCSYLTSEPAMSVWRKHVDSWWEDTKIKIKNGENFYLDGSMSWNSEELKQMMNEAGINVSLYYKSSYGHKFVYPIKVLLEYMSLEKLYHSGD
jgi:hypothetical protein